MVKVNPFRPNSPVNQTMFVGRLSELEHLEQALLQTRAGQPKNFLVTGERGIGKTSLLHWIRVAAQAKVEIDGVRPNFLVAEVDVDKNTTQTTLVKRIEASLMRGLAQAERARSVLGKTWEFVKRLEVAGVKLNPGEPDLEPDLLLDNLAYSLADTANRLRPSSDPKSRLDATFDGIVILIDGAS
jgi:hypothetical protein